MTDLHSPPHCLTHNPSYTFPLNLASRRDTGRIPNPSHRLKSTSQLEPLARNKHSLKMPHRLHSTSQSPELRLARNMHVLSPPLHHLPHDPGSHYQPPIKTSATDFPAPPSLT